MFLTLGSQNGFSVFRSLDKCMILIEHAIQMWSKRLINDGESAGKCLARPRCFYCQFLQQPTVSNALWFHEPKIDDVNIWTVRACHTLAVTSNDSSFGTAFGGKVILASGNSGQTSSLSWLVTTCLRDFRRQTTANVEHCVILQAATGKEKSGT